MYHSNNGLVFESRKPLTLNEVIDDDDDDDDDDADDCFIKPHYLATM